MASADIAEASDAGNGIISVRITTTAAAASNTLYWFYCWWYRVLISTVWRDFARDSFRHDSARYCGIRLYGCRHFQSAATITYYACHISARAPIRYEAKIFRRRELLAFHNTIGFQCLPLLGRHARAKMTYTRFRRRRSTDILSLWWFYIFSRFLRVSPDGTHIYYFRFRLVRNIKRKIFS